MAKLIAAGKITKQFGRTVYLVRTERYPDGTMTFDIKTMAAIEKAEKGRVAISADS